MGGNGPRQSHSERSGALHWVCLSARSCWQPNGSGHSRCPGTAAKDCSVDASWPTKSSVMSMAPLLTERSENVTQSSDSSGTIALRIDWAGADAEVRNRHRLSWLRRRSSRKAVDIVTVTDLHVSEDPPITQLPSEYVESLKRLGASDRLLKHLARLAPGNEAERPTK